MVKSKNQLVLRYLLLGVVAFLVIGLCFKMYQIRSEKRAFAKAEVYIDSLAADIQNTIGQASETKKEKSCDRPNMKYTQGDLRCNVAISLSYPISDASVASDLMHKAASGIDNPIRPASAAAEGSAFVSQAAKKGEQIFYQKTAPQSSLSCTISYTYSSDTNTEKTLELHLGCSANTISRLFPLRD